MGWMYSLVDCNCWKLPNGKRLELYQKEAILSVREYSWDWDDAQALLSREVPYV